MNLHSLNKIPHNSNSIQDTNSDNSSCMLESSINWRQFTGLKVNERILLTYSPLENMNWMSLLVNEGAGGISSFIGTTRGTFNGKIVVRLEYEAYEKMALRLMSRISDQIHKRWSEVYHVVIWHRLGHVPTTEASIIIAVSSAHRAACIEATEWGINELKAIVPVFKKEIYSDGSEWKQNCEFCVSNNKKNHMH